jgi:cytochrome c-type biogenesis protein CcmE
MTGFYVRWGGLLIVAAVLALLVARNYERNLATLSPEDLLADPPSHVIRVSGLVRGGTLTGDPAAGRLRFDLSGARETLAVQYDGPPTENLRELKTLVVVGRWDSTSRRFLANDLALVTNYGFVVSAYLVGLGPLALLLFTMERKVGLLHQEIKESKLYEPETMDA